jgi:hypothetical protein
MVMVCLVLMIFDLDPFLTGCYFILPNGRVPVKVGCAVGILARALEGGGNHYEVMPLSLRGASY